LLKQFLKKALDVKCLLLYLILLISCKSFAFQTAKGANFSQFLLRVEKTQDASPADALALLKSFDGDLSAHPLDERIKYYKILSELHVEHSQFQLAISTTSKGLQLAKQLSSPSILMADLFYSRGFSHESLGDYESAVQEYLNGLEVAESLNEQKYIAEGLANLGAIYYITERFERSLIMLNDALAIANQLDDEELKGFIHSELGILYSYIGQDDKSLEFYRRSYEHYQKAGLPLYALNSLMNIGTNHSTNKRYEKAIKVFKEVIDNSEGMTINQILYTAYTGLAWAHIKKEDSDPEAAHQYMLIAGQYIVDEERHDLPLIHALDKAYILESMKRYDEALASLADAEKLIAQEKQYQSSIPYVNVLKLRADIYFAQEDFERAFNIQTEYLKRYSQVRESNNIESIEDIRLRYESEHADLENKLLAQKQSVHELELREASQEVEDQQLYLFITSVIALVFAYFLVKVIRGQRKLLRVSRIDDLTGVANRRHLIQLGNEYFARASEQDEAFSVLMVDVDNFKQVNDLMGHRGGDRVLKHIAETGHETMRKSDLFGRFGGEEFIALLPETDQQQALLIAQRLRKAVNQFPWRLGDERKISISIGLATLDKEQHENFESLIKAADILLYQAKAQGKNTVCV